jgi:hypothetical protein
MTDDLIILLTGTIVPNTISCSYSDPEIRRREYLDSIRYYSQYGPVYFLENSQFPIDTDEEFHSIKNLYLRKFPPSKSFYKGKGFQEFEMINKWLINEPNPPKRFVKITGRYKVKNFIRILEECRLEQNPCIIIDQSSKIKKWAYTQLFYCHTRYYLENFSNLYLESDDSLHFYIENVFFNKLQNSRLCFRVFNNEPIFTGFSGTTGKKIEKMQIRQKLNKVLREMNKIFSNQYLYYDILSHRRK